MPDVSALLAGATDRPIDPAIDRRGAIARIAYFTGGLALAGMLPAGCRRAPTPRDAPYTADERALLDEVAETIMPTTTTPGAKAAGVGAFLIAAIDECYADDAYAAFRDGVRAIDDAARTRHGRTFVACTPAQRTALLNALDREARDHARAKERGAPPHYFALMKDLTIIGYFTSEVGSTRALRYVESPGAYRGDVPYRRGDRAWFTPGRRYG